MGKPKNVYQSVDFGYHRRNETHWIEKLVKAEDLIEDLQVRLKVANDRIRLLEEVEKKRVEAGSCTCQRRKSPCPS